MSKNHTRTLAAPKTHIVTAAGVSFLVGMSLLTFPSSDVSAHRSNLVIPLDLSVSAPSAHERKPLADSVVAKHPLSSLTSFEAQASFDPQSEAADPLKEKVGQIIEQLGAQPVAQAQPIDLLNSGGEVLPSGPRLVTLEVKDKDTLSEVFNRVGLPVTTLYEILASSKDAKRLSNLRVGQKIDFTISEDRQFLRLSTKAGELKTLVVERSDNGYQTRVDVIKPDTRVSYAHGKISSSLFLATQKADVPRTIAHKLADLFAYDVDFAKDIAPGDEFDLMFESKIVDGRRVGSGEILAARFTNRGKTYTAIRFKNSQGNIEYLDAQGVSPRKAFIRTPVDFARVSSRFSSGRNHPILNKIRAHKGVDYAAPIGTPIKATGKGVVVYKGKKNGYGNIVVIKHGVKYQTFYAHMSSFAKGVTTGKSVGQGQIIGYVGMTGLATGPHLHYEFRVNGNAVDPLSHKLPAADPLTGKERQRFLSVSQPLMAQLDSKKTAYLARN